MAMTRYNRTNELFTPFFDDMFAPIRRAEMAPRVPDTDVVETEDRIRVVAELPGLRPEDIDVSLENNVLTIRGEKREEREEKDERGTVHLSERRWGRFSRSFVLPREVEQDRIAADYRDGLLTITIPKSEKARRRRIEISGGETEGRRIETGSGK